LLGEPVYQHVDERAHLAAQVPAMRIERIDLQLLRPVLGQQRHQRSRGYQVRNQERRRQYRPMPAIAAACVVPEPLLIRLPDMRATTGLPSASRNCHSSGDGA
jgi:hypothetical protein